ncbi:fatty acid desaturase [Aurantimonas sp. 22II-16-19i]|uniref:fatty acid desaturase family protein n=1 Tax=Aurantimonas sp. 22II-16-19i TaxID=1317114 RepID=UPI0009F7A2CE|nr:fatty acid desaturase [Aurantimonas sp. 22II-16-19i]ORE90595.1 fatty acid desaturase [Aurantimonas sp. 22II-16-19i]
MKNLAIISSELETAPAISMPPVVSVRDLDRDDRRRLLKRTPLRTGTKFGFALSAIAAALVAVFHRETLFGTGMGGILPLAGLMVILGLLYAHFTELQHELLHGHGFRSDAINRALGFVCGLFTLSSYSHYRYHHLAHHRFLGTDRNSEFFTYPKRGLDGVGKLVLAALDPSRFGTVARRIGRALVGKPIEDVADPLVARQVAQEYAAYGLILAASAVYGVATGDPFVLIAWIIPLVLVAEPTHFLIELPEHFGLDAHGMRDVRLNTRSIEASPLLRWLTNGNNLHTAHHLMAGVPMERCPELHRLTRESYGAVEPSYLAFYRKVVAGEIKPFDNARGTLN